MNLVRVGALTRGRLLSVVVGCVAWLAPAMAQEPGEALAAFKAGAAARSRLADATGIFNDLIAAQVGASGRFNFGAFPAGGAALAGSQSFNLSFAWPSQPGTSYTTVRVDGQDLVFGQSELPLTGPPSNVGELSTAIAENSLVRVVQTLQLVNGPNSARPDTVLITYAVTNLTAAPQQAGLRIMIDTMLAGNDAAPFRIPGLGALTTERMFSGAEVPTFWQAFQSLDNPGTASQGTLSGAGAVTPTRFAVGNWGRLQSSLYDFTADPALQTGDSGIGVWWDDLAIAPQQTVTVATYYGLGDQTVAQGSVNLGVSAPAEVSLAAPRFQIAATVENPSAEVRADVVVDLLLPAGFGVVASSRAEVGVGDLGPGQSAAAVFDVDASGATPGTHTYTVTAGPRSDPLPVSVTRQMQVVGQSMTGVVDPATSHFLVAPDSPVDPTSGLAPLGTELRLIAELNDSSGLPVPGVAASRVTYAVSPPDGAQLTPPVAPSADDGTLVAVLIGLLRGTVTVTAAFDGTPFGSPVVLHFDDVAPAVASFDLAAGLHLLSQPVFETAPTTATRGRGLLSPVYYDAAARRYFVGDRMTNTPGLGYFVRNSAPLQFAVEGYLPLALAPTPLGGLPLVLSTVGSDEVAGVVARGTRQTVAVGFGLPLLGEWNLLGNPFGYPLVWRLADFEVWVNGARLGTLAEPATWSYVDPYAFVYERGRYRLIFDRAMPGFGDTANELGVLRGFWMRRTVSNDAIELRYQPAVSTAVLRSVPGGGWSFTLTAATTAGAASVVCGAAPGLGRSLSIATPPAVGEPEVDLVLLQGTARLAGEIVDSLAGGYTFDAVATGRAGREVTLGWGDLGRQLPAGWQAVLTDLQTGHRVSMRTQSFYSYTSQGESRRFTVTVSRRSPGALAVQVQAAPTRSRGASVTLVLNQPAEVWLRVTSLSGRLVREVASGTVAAGASAVSWDGLDHAGRRVPAGLYQVVAVAESDEGEIARAMTTVSVP